MTQPVIPTLNYAASATHRSARQRTPMQVALFFLALPALVTPFVPFTFGISPLRAIDTVPGFADSNWPLYLIALTFFAAFPILAWKARLLLFPSSPRRWEHRVLAVVAVIITTPVLIVVGWMIWEAPDLIRYGNFGGETTAMFTIALGTLAVAVTAMAFRWRRRGWTAAVETLLVTGYLINAGICLLAFRPDPNLGYWLTVPVAASFAAEMLAPRPPNL